MTHWLFNYYRRFRWQVVYPDGNVTCRLTREEAKNLVAVFGGQRRRYTETLA